MPVATMRLQNRSEAYLRSAPRVPPLPRQAHAARTPTKTGPPRGALRRERDGDRSTHNDTPADQAASLQQADSRLQAIAAGWEKGGHGKELPAAGLSAPRSGEDRLLAKPERQRYQRPVTVRINEARVLSHSRRHEGGAARGGLNGTRYEAMVRDRDTNLRNLTRTKAERRQGRDDGQPVAGGPTRAR